MLCGDRRRNEIDDVVLHPVAQLGGHLTRGGVDLHHLARSAVVDVGIRAPRLPLTREEASLFFRLLVRRYERASLIVTSNKSFVDWGEVFNDQILATAILDRLLHHATTVNIKGDSYRLREKKKAGLLGRKPKPAAELEEEEVRAEA
jgi:hypothetical protein